MRTAVLSMTLGAAASLLVPGRAAAVAIGDPAPALNIENWVRGKPVSLADAKGKNVVIVEFWATWCGPCRQTIPHLSKLQAAHKKDGLLVVGLTREKVGPVKTWLKRNPDIQMDYHVGVDTAGDTYKAYMADVGGIPHAYVVDKTGTVVWSGHPMSGMDRVVSQVLAGTFDVKKAIAVGKLMKQFRQALRKRNTGLILKTVDQLIEKEPDNPEHYNWKIRVLQYQGRGAEAVAVRRLMAKTFDDNADVLNRVARGLATAEDLRQRDLKLAMSTSQRAVELTSRKNASMLDTLARVHAALGLWGKAIAIQGEAIAVGSKGEKKTMAAAMTYYRTAKALAAQYAKE